MTEVLFQTVAREWWERHMLRGNAGYAGESWRRLEREAMPELGQQPLTSISAPMILAVLRRIESRGTVEAAHKLKSHISQIFRYGIACGLAYSNPARDLGWALTPRKSLPRAAIIEPREAGRLMADITHMRSGVKRCALKLLALTFVRSGELRLAQWKEIDQDTAQWRIPAAVMKMNRAHIVPLSRQALETLCELRAMNTPGLYLFPSIRRRDDSPMSGSVLRQALRGLGYGNDVMCPHGFRAMAATLLSEQGWSSEAIERQLAHVDRNAVRAAYQRSELLAERRKMMQAWADYLDLRCAQAILGR